MSHWIHRDLKILEGAMNRQGLDVVLDSKQEDEHCVVGKLGNHSIEIYYPEEFSQNIDTWVINYKDTSVMGKTLAEAVRNLKEIINL